MHHSIVSLLLFFATTLVALQSPAAAGGVSMAWSYVGNPNNPADATVMNDGTLGYGSVPYSYNIGTYDVTNSQYVAFLNSNDPTGADPLGLYGDSPPLYYLPYGGINFNSAAPDGSKYSAISGDGQHPANFVTFFDALRFANWLDNGQVPGSTETGAYTLLGGRPTPSNANSITRNPGATIFLPTENEWYKAAFYNPATSSYYQYATSSNAAPFATLPTATPNTANYDALPHEVGPGTLTDVGAYSGTTSPYGAFDMDGNVFQWNETLIFDGQRGVRGGTFDGLPDYLLSSGRGWDQPGDFNQNTGFRLASIPEPSTGVLAVVAFGLMWVLRRRLR
jgi:sulfatase modifying factor 1